MRFWIVLLYIISTSSFGQITSQNNLSSILNSQLSNREKEIKINSFLKGLSNVQDLEKAEYYYIVAKWHWSKNKDELKAIQFGERELSIRLSQKEKNNDKIKRNLYNLGYFYRNADFPNYNKALYYLNQLISISDENEKRLGKVYREKGDIYDNQGDFQKALDNYRLSLRYLRNQNDLSGLLITHINISATYANLNDPRFADAFFKNQQELKALEKQINISPLRKARLHLNHGIILSTLKHTDSAKQQYDRALAISISEQDNNLTFKTLTALGVHYSNLNKYTQASKFIEQSNKYTQKDPFLKSIVYDNQADILLRSKEFEKAIAHYNKAINSLLISERNFESFESTLNIKNIALSPFKRDILDYLIHSSNAWLSFYENSKKKEHLVKAENIITLADQTIDLLFSESSEELSKLFWRQKSADIYLKGVEISYLLENPLRALYYMEKNKGLLLLENFNDKLAVELAQIPEDQIALKNKLLKEVKTLQRELSTEISLKNNTQIENIRTALTNKKDQYYTHISTLENRFKAYSNYKNQTGIPPAKQLQSNIEPEEVVLEYILGDTKGFLVIVTRNDIQLKRLDHFERLQELVDKFQKDTSRPLRTTEEISNFEQNSYELFKLLMPFEGIENKKICIIPDGLLQMISFEALITSNPSITNQEYLIFSNNLYYKYSLSLGEASKQIKTAQFSNPIAFIPTNYTSNYLPNLTFGLNEKEALEPIFGTNIQTHQKATKGAFMSAYNSSNILHISTHGGIVDNKPWLGFYDEKLMLDELFYIQNSKSLVVLSACKTSVGEIHKGEGTFNIARGFLNSGAQSVISTLWEVNEKSSLSIINNFYNHLSEGQRKSQALRLSKLSYLKAHKNTSMASPYFWSNIVLTGDNNTLHIANKKTTKHTYLFIALAFTIMVVVLFKKYVQPNYNR